MFVRVIVECLEDFYLTLKKILIEHSWLGKILLVFVFTFLVDMLFVKILKKLRTRSRRSGRDWDEVIFTALQPPMRASIWITGIYYAIDLADHAIEHDTILKFLEPLQNIAIIFCLLWFLVRFIGFGERHYLHTIHRRKNHRVDITAVNAISKLLRIAVLFIAALMALPVFGFHMQGLLAFGGIGGVIVGFAAKDLLANFFGGFTIFMDKPFRVGEWIYSSDKSIEGTVEEIGWRLTRIRTFDRRPLYVPNGLFTNISIINASRMENRRINTIIGLRYDDWQKISVVSSTIENMLRNHPGIDPDKTLYVKLVKFGASSLDLQIYTFTKTIETLEFQTLQQEIFLNILQIIDDLGAECAFPTTLNLLRNVHVPKE